MTDSAVHLVIPCFRESGRLGPFLGDLCAEAANLQSCTVLVVDDGSGAEEQSRMRELLAPLMAQHSFLHAYYMEENKGKGATVYAGWDQHEGQRWLGFVDADGSCSAAEVARLIRLARAESRRDRAYFASRIKMLGRSVDRLLRRHLLGRAYATIVSNLLDLPVYDSQCGLKLVPREAFEKIRDHPTVSGFAFDVELLVLLLEQNTGVVEVPIDWHEVPRGKVRLLRDSILMFRDVLRIRHLRMMRMKPLPE